MYGPELLPALIKCWSVLRAPAGKLLAALLPVLVLRTEQQLMISDEQARLLIRMSAAGTPFQIRIKANLGCTSHFNPIAHQWIFDSIVDYEGRIQFDSGVTATADPGLAGYMPWSSPLRRKTMIPSRRWTADSDVPQLRGCRRVTPQ